MGRDKPAERAAAGKRTGTILGRPALRDWSGGCILGTYGEAVAQWELRGH